jgi:hypothetical protein
MISGQKKLLTLKPLNGIRGNWSHNPIFAASKLFSRWQQHQISAGA